jgi:ankyrin repeat protein
MLLLLACRMIRVDSLDDCNFGPGQKRFIESVARTKGVAVDSLTHDGFTAMEIATSFNCRSGVEYLLAAGANIEWRDLYNSTHLCNAAYIGRVEIAQVLLDHGAKRDAICEHNETALGRAARVANANVTRLLLEAGAEVDGHGDGGPTPLMNACIGKNLEVAKILLDAGANATLKLWCEGEGEASPLDMAISWGRVAIVEAMLAHGVDLGRGSSGGNTLRYAVECKRTKIVKLLVGAGASVDDVDERGRTAFVFATGVGSVKIMRFLKDAGSWLDSSDVDGLTTLHYAVYSGNPRAVREMLKWNAVDVNARSNSGLAPLHVAVTGNSTAIVKMLIDAGADVNAITTEAEPATVVQMAVLKGQDVPEIVDALVNAGAELTVKFRGDSLLVVAAGSERWRIVDYLTSPAMAAAWTTLELKVVRQTPRITTDERGL